MVDDLHVGNDKSFHRFSITFHILQEVAKRLGGEIENPFNGIQSSHTISGISRSFEIKVIKSTGQLNLNQAGSLSTQMEQGETPFESKIPPTRKLEDINDETVILFLDLLTVLLELCPTFATRLSAVQGNERGGGLLAELAVDAAAKSMTGEDVDIIKSAIRFLKRLVSYRFCHIYMTLVLFKDC